LKLLSEKFARNESARSRFQNEVQYVAHLDHPNIVKIYDHGETDGRPFFVMEFLDGVDLARFMKEEPHRTIERCVEIARQLCEALDFAHRHNVVHRDVKPANVMIVRRGDSEQIKLVDFGIIHVDSSKMTRDGTQPGTSAYSSPEQLRNDPIDHRSDLFSLGIVLYELFANVYPFDAPSEALITQHILQREPESPRKKNAAIPAAIDVLLMKLLEKDPAQRPQTAGEVADVLRQQMRKLQSRWASTDPAEYENLDEITREAVDKLVAWARQKEADGALKEAVDAYEKASRLAPESDRIQRRIPKLKHRIESERVLKEHLGKAATALAGGHFPEARAHWKNAWILSPESEDVVALELRIDQAEKAVPDDREKKQFVDGLISKAEEALDAGRLDDARAEVVHLLQRYPKDPLANFMLERILSIIVSGVDYPAYRKSIREARDLTDAGRFADARARCAEAKALWPGDEEAAGVERDIDQRIEGEVAALATRVERSLLRADDPEVEDKTAFDQIAAVRVDVETARGLSPDAAWIRSSSDDADRIERSVRERVARAEAFRREQDEQRRKRIDMFLQRGRNQLADADVLARRATTEPGPAIEGYGAARDSFERVLHDDATQSEALDARRRIEDQLRDLAERIDRARETEREIASALEGARAAIAQMEIAGGAHAADLGAMTAMLHEADLALDHVLSVDPRHSDAVPLRAHVASLRSDVLKEQERREAQAIAARKAAEQVERRRLAEERRAAEQAELSRKAQKDRAAEDARLQAVKELEAREELERERQRERQKELHEKEKGADKPITKQGPSSAVKSDSRKIAEFEKGLAKQRRLAQQGRAREASDIKKILEAEADADPQLRELYAEAFPAEPGGGSRRGLIWGAIAGAAVVGVAGIWITFGGRPAPTPAPAPVHEPPPEPFLPPAAPPDPPVEQQSSAASVPAPRPVSPPVPEPSKPQFKPEITPSTRAKPPDKPPDKPPQKPTPHVLLPVVTPIQRPPEPAPAIPESGAKIRACLKTAAGQPAGAGYKIVFSLVGGADTESPPTDASGCATLGVPITQAAMFRPAYAKGTGAEHLDVVQPQPMRIYPGQFWPIDVELKR
jgi:hypothetical protein